MKYFLIIFFLNINIYALRAQEIEANQYEHIMSICGDEDSFIKNNNGEIKKISEKSFFYKSPTKNNITNKYLIKDDFVLTGVQYHNFTCIMYKMHNDKYITGWVSSNS